MKVNGKDYPIYDGKIKMFQTTNRSYESTEKGSIRPRKIAPRELFHFTPRSRKFPKAFHGSHDSPRLYHNFHTAKVHEERRSSNHKPHEIEEENPSVVPSTLRKKSPASHGGYKKKLR
jgi:hypothetical protein